MSLRVAATLSALFGVVACAGGTDPVSPSTDPPPVARGLDAMRGEAGVPGMSIAIVRNGQINVETYGSMDASTGQPVQAGTRFQAASISKLVTALAALTMVESGTFGLDEPVNDLLHSWTLPESAYTQDRPVTTRHLLSHTAGTTVSGFQGYAHGEAVPTTSQVLDGSAPANSAPVIVDQAPGAAFRYSGGGYTVVQQLVADLRREPFEAALASLVLSPLGMTSSSFAQPIPLSASSDYARGHTEGRRVPGGFHVYPEMAAAGLWSTAADLALVILEIQLALAGQSETLVSGPSAELMTTPVSPQYGLGVVPLARGGERYFSHSGRNEGFDALLIGHMEAGVGAVVLTNGQSDTLIWNVLDFLGKRERWPGF